MQKYRMENSRSHRGEGASRLPGAVKSTAQKRVEWDEIRQLITCRVEGRVRGTEVVSAIEEIRRIAQDYRGRLHMCWDCRYVQTLVVSPEELSDISESMRRFAAEHPRGRTAMVTSRPTTRHIAQLLVFRGRHQARIRRVFSEMKKAERWIMQSSCNSIRRWLMMPSRRFRMVS